MTIAEAGLGILLILGFFTRVAALLTGMITLAFAAAMIFVLGVHGPLIHSVFVFSAASFLLASQTPDKLSIDKYRGTTMLAQKQNRSATSNLRMSEFS